MDDLLNGLEPAAVFRYFEEITRIPHGSGHEAGIAAYLTEFAGAHGLSYREDAMHNVLIRKDASAGYEAEPAVMLQGHTDMVCQKRPDAVHDFEKDPLSLRVSDGWLSADGTTLGADDGIAVAVMMAVLTDDAISHPKLECLFTVQEEIGLCGAAGFDYSDINAKLLINLDSETEGVGTVSCAGGIRCDITRPVTFEETDGCTVTLCVSGLKGGHSGAEIHMHRGNAHKIAGAVLAALAEEYDIRLSSLDGGNMDNAIPRECTAVFTVPAAERDAACAQLDALLGEQRAILSASDRQTGMLTYAVSGGTVSVMGRKDTADVLSLLIVTPDGVHSMCEDLPSLVESSCNMGILRTDGNAVTFGFLARSSVEAKKEELRLMLARCAAMCGAEISCSGSYPGWAYDKYSEAARRYCAVYERLYGKKPVIEAIHAGLECGLMKHAVPGIDPISIGPDMADIHTPDERVRIASVAGVYRTVLGMLAWKD